MPRTLLKAWALGLTAYALVYAREVPVAYAQTVIDTDCSTDLDQPDTTYRLTGDVAGSCVIAADNIILDGQNLYTISGNVTATTTATVSFTVRDVEVGGNVYNGVGFLGNQHLGNQHIDIGNLTIDHAVVGGMVGGFSPDYSVGNLTVTDSTVGTTFIGSSAHGATVGDVIIENSTVIAGGSYFGVGLINAYGPNGTITITDSTIEGMVMNGGEDLDAGNVNIVRSTVTVPVAEQYNSYALLGATCDITDSSIHISDRKILCGTLTITDNPPDLNVTPLSLELDMGDSFNPFTGVSADDVKDGDLSDDVMVIGSVGDEPGVYELVYSVTDAGTTLFNTYDNATTTSGPSTASTTRTVTRLATDTTSGSQSTRVGHRSSDTTPSSPSQTTTTASLDATLDQLRTVLSQPITTTDPEKLKELLNLLLQLVAALSELMAKTGR